MCVTQISAFLLSSGSSIITISVCPGSTGCEVQCCFGPQSKVAITTTKPEMITATLAPCTETKTNSKNLGSLVKNLKGKDAFGREVVVGFISYSKANNYKNPLWTFLLLFQISSWSLESLGPALPSPSGFCMAAG